MHTLTPDTLDEERLRGAVDSDTYERAKALYEGGFVQVKKVAERIANCTVLDRRNYFVELKIANSYLYFKCTCLHAGRGLVCEHDLAASFAVREHLRQNEPPKWQTQLDSLVSEMRLGTPQNTAARYLLFFSLQQAPYMTNWLLTPYQLAESALPKELRGLNTPTKPEALWKVITEYKLGSQLKSPYHALDSSACINCPPEGVALANLIQERSGYHRSYHDRFPLDEYLNLLASTTSPLFLGSETAPLQQKLDILPSQGRMALYLERNQDGVRISPSLSLGEDGAAPLSGKVRIIDGEQVWALVDNYLCPVENPAWIELLNRFKSNPVLTIPPEHESDFLENYYLKLARLAPLEGEGISWQTVDEPPQPRLYLSETGGELQARLRFAYGECEVRYANNLPDKSIDKQANSWTLLHVIRRPDQEASIYEALASNRYGLKRASAREPDGSFRLRAHTDPASFLLKMAPRLARDGFTVYGEEGLKSARVNRNTPTISFTVSSGIDWFDIKTVVNFGEIEVSLKELRAALRKKERYIKLVDGSIGELPEEWFERYKHLFALGEAKGDNLQLSRHHLGLVESAIDLADQSAVDEAFEDQRRRLRSLTKGGFAGIQPQALPPGFNGELRPYQKAGYDWLHFLRQQRFGGCLADDMGLGKTIQALAFLESLYGENGNLPPRPENASLLVVPRSLLFNWQREAERFTPRLKVLEYFDAKRVKDLAAFDQADLLITTYGVMLRDIEFLHGYTFQYAILDESQSIKNPLSQTARAARLIQAHHKLVLTGTPIENSTSELWSQFAFLNPGLLGNMQYFKREFGTPIERKGDENASQALRALVYPFILRRTKSQVAPELPPRSERILYSDMEPAQRKLYNKTRDYYRGMLLGMFDQGGLNNNRMKILEGLLRLRQISNHPRLVDAKFRGESGKFELLLDTVETLVCEGHKALIFSQFVQMLTLVRKALDKRSLPYAYLDGSTGDRQSQVDSFQNDPNLPLFLISLKAGGLGLNLTAADYVIHIDPWWNPAVEMQASDRTHRIGQDKPVFIYKLITRDSVEEKIIRLQESKKQLVDQIITTEASFFKSLTEEDIEVLFSL